MASHGDITEIRFSHPTLGSGVFEPKAAEGNTFDPGGIRTNDDANGITSNGDLIVIKNRVRGHFEVMIENDMNIRNDAKIIAELAADPVPAQYTVSIINGTVWAGSGFPVADIAPDINAGTMTLKIASGNWKKIVG
jgi:hypothetical protein